MKLYHLQKLISVTITKYLEDLFQTIYQINRSDPTKLTSLQIMIF